MRALLISHSGRPYLAHARAELLDFLGPARRLGFVTAASLGDEEAYYETARGALAPEIVLEHMRWERASRPSGYRPARVCHSDPARRPTVARAPWPVRLGHRPPGG